MTEVPPVLFPPTVSPPPEIVVLAVVVGTAADPTFTLTVMGGAEAPEATAVVRVHDALAPEPLHDQPLPDTNT